MAGVPKKMGYLQNLCKGVAREENWQRRYYVLLPASEKNQARLDWYESEKDFNQNCHADQTKRKTIYIEEMEGVEKPEDSSGKKHSFSVKCKDRTHFFAADNMNEAKQWRVALSDIIEQTKSPTTSETQSATDSLEDLSSENSIYESAQVTIQNFRIEVLSTGASDKANYRGEYDLEISLKNITIKDIRTRLKVCSWPIKGIRRYGKSKSNFTFESGRRCETGDGLWKFKTSQGECIFNAIQTNTNLMKQADRKGQGARGSGLAAGGITRQGSVDAAPDIPDRKYDAGTYVSIINEGSEGNVKSGSAAAKSAATRASPAPKPPQEETKKKGIFGFGKTKPKAGKGKTEVVAPDEQSMYANLPDESSYENNQSHPPAKGGNYTYASTAPTRAVGIGAAIKTPAEYSEPMGAIQPHYGDGEYSAYAEPEIVQGHGAKMSDITAGIKKKERESNKLDYMQGSEEYDHIVLSKKPSVGIKQVDNTYDRLDGDEHAMTEDGTYSEIGYTKPT